MKTVPQKGPNWIPLADPITEGEVKIEVTWTADLRIQKAIERRAAIMGFETSTAYFAPSARHGNRRQRRGHRFEERRPARSRLHVCLRPQRRAGGHLKGWHVRGSGDSWNRNPVHFPLLLFAPSFEATAANQGANRTIAKVIHKTA
jgi:hypothetical protein